jgi:hypothetical protein
MKNIIFVSIIIFTTALQSVGQSKFEKDVFKTPSGKLTIIFIRHASLMFNFNGKIIHVDPWHRFADYETLPKADIILVTHHHPDHLDTNAITMISKNETQIILTSTVYDIIKKGLVMSNGDKKNIDEIVTFLQ